VKHGAQCYKDFVSTVSFRVERISANCLDSSAVVVIWYHAYFKCCNPLLNQLKRDVLLLETSFMLTSWYLIEELGMCYSYGTKI